MFLFAATSLISLIGLFEFYRVMNIEKSSLGWIGYAMTLLYYGLLWSGREEYMLLMSIFGLMVLMSVYVFTFPKYKTDEISAAFFGFFYVAVMLSYLYTGCG